ncbi:hypothetical protein [Mycolicibacterium sp. CH28]|uniref:hypothetical protein n=1 Tax=Mycolicibacterium sp. CH28 TaxID=2512237 RepID=UPI001386EB43|nr:hypothetical protein [Mycolicibacterium sp. CH28]
MLGAADTAAAGVSAALGVLTAAGSGVVAPGVETAEVGFGRVDAAALAVARLERPGRSSVAVVSGWLADCARRLVAVDLPRAGLDVPEEACAPPELSPAPPLSA